MTDFSCAPCPSCAAREMQTGRLTKESLEAHVASLVYVPGFSADADLYKMRLEVCSHCVALQGGMFCAYSATYVSYRAKMLGASCPFPQNDKWKDL